MKKSDFKLNIQTDLTESTVDISNRIIKDVAILSQVSRDKAGNVRRKYTDNALMSAINVFEGAGACVGHVTNKSRERGLLEYYGVYKNLTIKKDMSGMGTVIGNLEVFECKEGDQVLNIAKAAPHLGGNSIHTGGRGYREKGIEIIEEMLPYTSYGNKPSVDIVTNPATTLNLFENNSDSDNNNSDDNNNNKNQKRKKNMKEIDIMEATVDNLKLYRPDIMAQFDNSAEIKDLKESNETLEKENKELLDKVDVFEAQTALTSKVNLRDSLILAAKMPVELVTDTFKNSLINVIESKDEKGAVITIEEGMKALINDRAALTKGIKNMGGSHDVFESQENNNGENQADKIKPRDIVAAFTRKR